MNRVTGRGSPRLSEKVGSEVGHFPDFGLSSESVRHRLGMGMGRPPTERRPNRESRAEAQYSPQARMGQHGFLFVGECH